MIIENIYGYIQKKNWNVPKDYETFAFKTYGAISTIFFFYLLLAMGL